MVRSIIFHVGKSCVRDFPRQIKSQAKGNGLIQTKNIQLERLLYKLEENCSELIYPSANLVSCWIVSLLVPFGFVCSLECWRRRYSARLAASPDTSALGTNSPKLTFKELCIRHYLFVLTRKATNFQIKWNDLNTKRLWSAARTTVTSSTVSMR